MKQRVNNMSYLARVEIPLSTLSTAAQDLIALPAGAEIVSISVQVSEAGAANLNLGFSGAGNEGVIAQNLALSAVGVLGVNYAGTTQKSTAITGQLSAASATGIIIMRVLYFLPSQIEIEL